jgi:hypothetical protein
MLQWIVGIENAVLGIVDFPIVPRYPAGVIRVLQIDCALEASEQRDFPSATAPGRAAAREARGIATTNGRMPFPVESCRSLDWSNALENNGAKWNAGSCKDAKKH